MRECRNWTTKNQKKVNERRWRWSYVREKRRNECMVPVYCIRCGNEGMAHTKRSQNVGENPQSNERFKCQVKCMTHRYIIRETKRFCFHHLTVFVFFISRGLWSAQSTKKIIIINILSPAYVRRSTGWMEYMEMQAATIEYRKQWEKWNEKKTVEKKE